MPRLILGWRGVLLPRSRSGVRGGRERENDRGETEISRINLGLSRAGAPSYRLEKISIGILSHGIYYRDQLSQSLSAPLIARYSLA